MTQRGTTRVASYGYDSAGRLASVKQDGIETGSFSYDGNGNRTKEGATGASGTYDLRSRIVSYGSDTYAHDARGYRTSMIRGGTTVTYEHDARGALRIVKNGALGIAYDVDGWGRRVARRQNGAVTHRWLYRNALQPVAEYDATNTPRWRFLYSPGRHVPELAMDSDGATYKIVTDQLGSLRLVVRGSDGVIMQRMRHDAWGGLEEDYIAPGFPALPFGFAGGLVDRATRLVHFGLRDYDADVGRWIQPDPFGYGGGLNPYAYVGSSPVGYTDHAGLWRDDDPRIDRYNASMAAASDAERAGVMLMVGLAATPLAIEAVGLFALESAVASEVATIVGEVTAAEAGLGAGVGAGCAKAALPAVRGAQNQFGRHIYDWIGGGKAYFDREGSRILVDVLNRGDAPKGTAGQMLAQAIRASGGPRPTELYASNVLQKTAESDAVVGAALRQTAEALGGEGDERRVRYGDRKTLGTSCYRVLKRAMSHE